MTYIAGVDIGNSTTEVCIGEVGSTGHFLSSASCKTTGTKDHCQCSWDTGSIERSYGKDWDGDGSAFPDPPE